MYTILTIVTAVKEGLCIIYLPVFMVGHEARVRYDNRVTVW